MLIEHHLNEDLKSLANWLDNNLMKTNVSKTKVMLLGTPAKISKVSNIVVVMNGVNVNM